MLGNPAVELTEADEDGDETTLKRGATAAVWLRRKTEPARSELGDYPGKADEQSDERATAELEHRPLKGSGLRP